jgi:hypothetical protein
MITETDLYRHRPPVTCSNCLYGRQTMSHAVCVNASLNDCFWQEAFVLCSHWHCDTLLEQRNSANTHWRSAKTIRRAGTIAARIMQVCVLPNAMEQTSSSEDENRVTGEKNTAFYETLRLITAHSVLARLIHSTSLWRCFTMGRQTLSPDHSHLSSDQAWTE